MKFWPFNRDVVDLPADNAPASRAPNLITARMARPDSQKTATLFSESSLFFRGLPLSLGRYEVNRAYDASWVAYACIRRLSQDAAGVPLLILSDKDDPESEVPETHPARRMFSNARAKVLWMFLWLNLRGEFFLPFDDTLRPTSFRYLRDPLFWTEGVEGEDLTGWRYQLGAVAETYIPEGVIHHAFPNPRNPFRGQAPIQAAASAFGIQLGADTLTESVVARGGEKAMVLTADFDITPTQRAQAMASLRARHSYDGRVGQNSILPNGIRPIDPKFIDEDMKVLDAAAAQPEKLCSVYGVPRSLIGLAEESQAIARNTALARKRLYFEDTLLPMSKGVTGTLDHVFQDVLPSPYRCFFRFDWSSVEALQDSLAEKFDMAGKAHGSGLPWSVLNTRFELGLDEKEIPGADTVMVSSTLAPLDKLIEEWNNPAPPPSQTPAGGAAGAGGSPQGDGKTPRLTNAVIVKRAGDVREMIRRGQRLLKLEREFAADWRRELNVTLTAARKALGSEVPPASKMRATLAPAFKGLGERLAAAAQPKYEAAALEGERSILELVEGKMADQERDLWQKVHKWRPGTAALIRERVNLTVPTIADDLFSDVLTACTRSVQDGAEIHEVRQVLVQRMGSAPGGLNRSTTIARTEVGSAYNVARFSEMEGQGFKKHRWLTNGGELVRQPPDSEFDHAKCHDEIRPIGEAFSCGLTHPMEGGGAAGNVINCRCETIPHLEEQR